MKYGKIRYTYMLTEANKQVRIEHAIKLLSTDISRVLLSDESFFQLNENGLSVCHQEYAELYKEKKEKSYKNKQCMVWGVICISVKSTLYIHSTSIDSDAYIQCLGDSLIPMGIQNYGNRKKWYLLQDGARCHTSKKTLDWCASNKVNKIQNCLWSPDTNPIELVWGAQHEEKLQKKQLNNVSFGNREHLEQIILEIWEEQSQEFINKCINHVVNILPEIIETIGFYLI
ncbi:hypothetical protein ABPG74_021870 [Tetrahymena malaccensis]